MYTNLACQNEYDIIRYCLMYLFCLNNLGFLESYQDPTILSISQHFPGTLQ